VAGSDGDDGGAEVVSARCLPNCGGLLWLCEAASFDFAPAVDAAENEAGEQEQNYENSGDRKPSR